jgi:transcriptional regulator with XRE-family HTH domain
MQRHESALAGDLQQVAIDHKQAFKKAVRDDPDTLEARREARTELRDEFLPRYREAFREHMQQIRRDAQDVTLDQNDWAQIVDPASLPVRGDTENAAKGYSVVARAMRAQGRAIRCEAFEDSYEFVISEFARELYQRNDGRLGDGLDEETRERRDGRQQRKSLDRLADSTIEDTADKAGVAAVTEGRDDVAQAATDDDGKLVDSTDDKDDGIEEGKRLYAQRTAVLDANTCRPCEDLDGEIALVGSLTYNQIAPPNQCEGGHLCRCTFNYIRKAPQNIENATVVKMADNVSVGDFVSWSWSGGRAQGKVVEVERDGTLELPGEGITREGSADRAALRIQHYEEERDGYAPVDQEVLKYEDNVTAIDPLDKPDGSAHSATTLAAPDGDEWYQLFTWGDVQHTDHPDGGFEVDEDFAHQMLQAFHFMERRHDWHPPILQQHKHDGHVWGRVTDLRIEPGDGIYGQIDWSQAARQKLASGLIDSLSPTFTPEWTDPETGEQLARVLQEVSYVSVEHLRSLDGVQETLTQASDDRVLVALARDDGDTLPDDIAMATVEIDTETFRTQVNDFVDPTQGDTLDSVLGELASAMGESQSAVRAIYDGDTERTDFESLEAVAEILGIDAEELTTEGEIIESDDDEIESDTHEGPAMDYPPKPHLFVQQKLEDLPLLEKANTIQRLAEEAEIDPDRVQKAVEGELILLPDALVEANTRELDVDEESFRMGDLPVSMPQKGKGDKGGESSESGESGDGEDAPGETSGGRHDKDKEMAALRRENAELKLEAADREFSASEKRDALELAEQHGPSVLDTIVDLADGGTSSDDTESVSHDGAPDTEIGATGTAPTEGGIPDQQLEAFYEDAYELGVEPGPPMLDEIEDEFGSLEPHDPDLRREVYRRKERQAQASG